MAPIIADTSGFYALVDRNDPHHAAAAAFLKSIQTPGALLVSNHIFDEAMTLTKVRLGVSVARQLGMRLRNSRLIELIVVNGGEEAAAWRLFSNYDDKAWSYTDCVCLALAQSRDISQAFSFDHHFAQMGLQMLPY
ncbi:MAG: type II toxin-antitoxin system VapC family toxin [Caldilineaceae bacterium]|nr:type II toxin-antitoxin system VapC family toxin [Caldilineaceae bacterium]